MTTTPRPKQRLRGRPPLGESYRARSVRLPDALWDAMDRVSLAEGERNLSRWIREALWRAVARAEKKSSGGA